MLHKMVNGVRVELSAEEEATIRAEWKKNDALKVQRHIDQAAKKAKQDAAFDKLTQAMSAEEKSALREMLV